MPRAPYKLLKQHSLVWSRANPTLGNSEPALSTDNGQLRIGDGKTKWSDLESFVPAASTLTAIEAALSAGTGIVESDVPSLGTSPTPDDFGFKAWTFDYSTVSANAVVPNSGSLHLARFRNDTPGFLKVRTLSVYVVTAGVGLTNVGFGVWNYAAGGAKLGSVVNTAGATAAEFQTTTLKTVTLPTPVIIPPAGRFYLGFWFAGTTLPALLRGSTNGNIVNIGTVSPLLRYMSVNSPALTDTAPNTIGAPSLGANAWWAAVA